MELKHQRNNLMIIITYSIDFLFILKITSIVYFSQQKDELTTVLIEKIFQKSKS